MQVKISLFPFYMQNKDVSTLFSAKVPDERFIRNIQKYTCKIEQFLVKWTCEI